MGSFTGIIHGSPMIPLEENVDSFVSCVTHLDTVLLLGL